MWTWLYMYKCINYRIKLNIVLKKFHFSIIKRLKDINHDMADIQNWKKVTHEQYKHMPL